MLYHKLFRELSRNLRYIFFLTVCTKASDAGMHHLLEALVDALQQQAEYLLPVRPDLVAGRHQLYHAIFNSKSIKDVHSW